MNSAVSQSELRAWMDCPRRHWFIYERGLRPKRTPTAFLMGSAFHDAVSDYYSGVPEDRVLAHAQIVAAEANGVASVDGEWREAEEWETGEYQAAKLRGMLRAYAQTYLRDEFLNVLLLEKRLAVAKQIKDQLAEVEHALQKFAQGTYGSCDICGKPIPPDRLEAHPQASLCLECKSKNVKGR